MTDLSVFNVEGTDIRFGSTTDGTPYVVASDYAKTLGYRNASDATRLLDDAEKGAQIVRTPGGDQSMTVIYENGMWELIFRSTLPGAKSIKGRVKAILQEIRETGQYVPIPKTYAEALRAAADASEIAERATEQLAIAAPKVEAFDTYLSAHGKYLVGEVAKMLNVPNMGPVKLHDFLRARGVLMSGGAKHNMPYQRHIETGRFTVEGAVRRNAQTGELITREGGEPIAARTTHLTPKGVEYVRSLLIQAGHQPERVQIVS